MVSIQGLTSLIPTLGAAFLPTDIAGLQLWLDANDASTLFQDAAKTTAAGNGDVVGAWADKSGNGNDVLQATTSKKPSYQLGIQNGLPVVRFAGTDDVLSGGDILDLGTNSSTLYVVGKSTTNTGGYAGKSFPTHSPGRYALLYNGGLLRAEYGRSDGQKNATTSRTHGSFEIIGQVLKRDGDANRLRADGAQIASTAFDDDTASDWNNLWEFVVGNFGPTGTDLPLTGDIAEVVKYSRALVASEITQLEAYFSAKWGIAIA